MFYGTPETIIRQSTFRDEAMDVRIPFQRATKGMEDRDEAGGIAFGFVLFMKHVKNDAADSLKETIQKRTVFQKERPKVLIDGKNTVTMGTGDKFEGHTGGALLGISDSTGRAESAFATKRNKFHMVAMRANIHSASKRGVATMNHSVYVRNNDRTGMKLINHFFIMVSENLLQYIHKTIMQERREKENPYPLKIEGQGS